MALVMRETVPAPLGLAWAAAAGVSGVIGVVAFYRALAVGAMGLVAPLAALIGASMPLVVGLLTGDQPTVTDMGGVGVALVAVVLVSRPAEDQGLGRGGLGLAVISGVGFGGYFLCMDQAASAGVETWWPIVASRSVATILAVAAALALRRLGAVRREASRLMAGAGIADIGGNAFFLMANAQGSVGIAAVIASQYPAVTVVLARLVLGERLARIHVAGIVLAFVGIVLIALP
jgi:drug/metabolite transporter (DMT)-like permease